MHVHVMCGDGEAKIWLEPEIEVAVSYGMRPQQVRAALKMVEERSDEIRYEWNRHFSG